ncbi:MAG: hypothetical protein QXE30_06140 [Candidatus Bathyarchaeia archaeon]
MELKLEGLDIDDSLPTVINYNISQLKRFCEKDDDLTIIFYSGELLLQIDKIKGIFTGAVMMFIMSMQEISATIFIYKPSWETLPIGIFLQWWHGSEFGYPASLGLILLIITGVLLLISSKLGKRILGGAFAT